MEMSEPEERRIRDYVNSQSHDDDRAGLVQKVGARRILGRPREIYDVHCEHTRWWVITDPTNLYSQDDFPDFEQALIFHLGLGVIMAERERTELEEDQLEHVSTAWRRFSQAVDAMNDAGESEDYQAVGIKCRDALIALAKTHADAEWIGDLDERPKGADFKGWANIFADRLAEGRMRSYLKALVDKTWDLTVWLQHNANATPLDADIVIEATGQVLQVMSKLMRQREDGPIPRCPKCESYRLNEDIEQTTEPEPGFYESTVCESCGWRTDRTFTSFLDHFKDTRLLEYLATPGDGPSDRLGHERLPRPRTDDDDASGPRDEG
ncbi:hypothetical protein [Microbacterium sp. UCD-TDU]|uniref:hypothetical protein n=1 Tax=Microbacterium sp. UCD-TDU TaxID=1247714 RepID=UPI00037876ED|nr:hypothetical protein [Microbacterium sp. UCD-TDU]EYT59721.1 hypothetical protein D514_0108150 [Microbacterium sp. UCD-TDU]